ncbi:MAG: hypothetical protein ACD_3C00111G0001 [uncultured bacterium (gcode 4)]|uniref:Extracellular solute-binding protein family 1 n=1 Tax=uncultured bacterium (gcode 4) TaxID=1234023 RepID=K2GCL8_9BACT|nr:MAG: hypothetical protein ACD_3C00111G0001 [uncultured bacterium (gcode 4)]
MSKHKMIFFAIAWAIILLFSGSFMFLSSISDKGKAVWPKEFNVWVVWDETAWYSDIITWFKKKYSEYANTEVKFTKFSSYSDYEKILLNVMTDGNSPDIFVVNNASMTSEWDWILESKIVGLSKEIVDTDYFQKNFNKVFDELVLQNEEENVDWKKLKVDYLKWIPMWFETLWIYYNFKKLRNIPWTWADLDKEITDAAADSYSTIWLGLGSRYIHTPSDIVTLMFLQNWIESYKKLWEDSASKTLRAYLSYYSDPNNKLFEFKPEMDELRLTTADLFVRGKLGMIIWYPSLMKEIVLAIKRTSWSVKGVERYLRSAPIFQTDLSTWEDDKAEKTNIINYNYFALSKYSANQDMWFAFLSYLSTKEAQEKYLNSFSYYLPALRSLEDSRLDESIEKWFDRIKYKDFLLNDVTLKTFEKWLKTEYDVYFNNSLDFSWSTSKNILEKWQMNIECNVNHILKWLDFDKQCD